jgi:small subunit ribosomal protein S36
MCGRTVTPPILPAMTSAFAWRELWTGHARAVWAVAALHLGLVLCWSLITPVYEAPDEPQHIDLARGLAATWAYPEYDERQLSLQMTRSFEVIGHSETGNPLRRTREPVVAVEAPPRAERPSYGDLGPDLPSPHINPAPQHPPLYYTAVALLVTAVPDGLPVDLTVWLLRVLNALVLAPVPLLAAAAARRLTGAPVVGATAAVLLLAVPQYLHIGGAVNPDNLVTLQFAVLGLLLLAVAQGDLRLRLAVQVGLVTALALMTKGFALVLPAWIGAAYVIGLARTRDVRGALTAGGTAGAVGLGLGGWWWVRNLVVHGEIQTGVQGFPTRPGWDPAFSEWAEPAWSYLVERFWGSFGWVDVTLEEEVVTAAAWTLAVLLALGFALRPRAARWWRADLVLLLLPVVTIGAVMSWGSWETFSDTTRMTGMQGRYLFPGLPGLAVVAATGAAALVRGWARVLPLLALAAAAWLQWIATWTALFFWWGHPGIEEPRISIAAVLAWAPVPAPLTAAVGALTAAAALWLLGEALLLLRAPAPEAATAALAPARDDEDLPAEGTMSPEGADAPAPDDHEVPRG